MAAWVLEQDRIVVSRFEGRTFVVPSKVLSAPTILYPGLNWRRLDLRGLLLRLGYREHRFEAGAALLEDGAETGKKFCGAILGGGRLQNENALIFALESTNGTLRVHDG